MLSEDTVVTFHRGSVEESATVVFAGTCQLGGTPTTGFISDLTPFHPVDHRWPDQPCDVGTCILDGETVQVIGSFTAARQKSGGDIYLDKDIPARRGDEGWTYFVFHQLGRPEVTVNQGSTVRLRVDTSFRESLSRPHTAVHLVSLALNRVVADFWKKEISKDSLGNPNFDAEFITNSTIEPLLSKDLYRLGKSSRKKGLDTERIFKEYEDVAGKVNALVSQWLAGQGSACMFPEVARISDVREWRASLEGREALIPCGGTHVKDFSGIGSVAVAFEPDLENSSLRMLTRVS